MLLVHWPGNPRIYSVLQRLKREYPSTLLIDRVLLLHKSSVGDPSNFVEIIIGIMHITKVKLPLEREEYYNAFYHIARVPLVPFLYNICKPNFSLHVLFRWVKNAYFLKLSFDIRSKSTSKKIWLLGTD